MARSARTSPYQNSGGVVPDDVSKQIIEQLQQDGRRSYAAIGKAVGLSEAAVRQRVQRPQDHEVPVIVRGSGAYVYDQHGKRYLDGLSGLFVSQVGHGRAEIAEAGARQASELAYFPLWSYAHPKAIELAARLADMAPGDLNRVFFTTSGSEAVESALKLAQQYFKLTRETGPY